MESAADKLILTSSYYLNKKFKAKEEDEHKVIDSIVHEFSLNEEQERAFRIVANHATIKKVSSSKCIWEEWVEQENLRL